MRAWISLCLCACALDLPPADCALPDAVHLDCGTIETNVTTECRDGDPDAVVQSQPLGAEQSMTLCLDGPMSWARAESPCELPGGQYARRARASVGASCERLPSAGAPNVFAYRLTLEAAVEHACYTGGALGYGSAARAHPFWRGRLVAPATGRQLVRVDVHATRAFPDCIVRVGDRDATPRAGTSTPLFASLTGPAALDASIDCRAREGLTTLACYSFDPNAVSHPATLVERLVVDFVFAPPTTSAPDGGP